MPTKRAARAAKAVLFNECGYSEHQFERWAEGSPFIHRVASEIDREASLPALEAVAEAARQVLEECCYPDTLKFRSARSGLRAALAKLDGEE